jgi:hypothetical protein
MKNKKRKNALAEAVKSKKPEVVKSQEAEVVMSQEAEVMKSQEAEVVWDHIQYDRELYNAKKIGPEKMSDDALLSFCHGVSGYYYGHFWADARPFFQELWRRIEAGNLRMSKSEACRRIGCTRQWANEIVSGRADEHREASAKAKEAKGGKLLSAASVSTALLTDDEYVDEISKHAFATLEPLLQSNNWERYRTICEELAKQFEDASKTTPTGKARAAGAGTN